MPDSVGTFNVTVNGSPEVRLLTDLDILYEDGKHGLALIDVLYPIPRRKGKNIPRYFPSQAIWRRNSLVQVDFGWTSSVAKSQFLGYMQGYRVVQNANDPLLATNIRVQYIVLGTSVPMQTVRSRSWTGVTASYIARTLAQANGLRPIVDTSPGLLDYAQSNKSDFKTLAELASRIGYRFFVNGPNLYFVNPYNQFNVANRRSVPVFTKDALVETVDTLRDFKMIEGELTSDGGVAATRLLHAYNPNTNALVTATNQYLKFGAFQDPHGPKPMVTVVHSAYTADSYNEALALLAADTVANRHWLTAQATVIGTPNLEPGSIVDFEGEGMLPNNRGVWMLRKAEHRIHRDMRHPTLSTYLTDIEVGRDQINTTQFVVPPEWTTALAKVGTTVRNGQWAAASVASA